jgi:hypothetical protein
MELLEVRGQKRMSLVIALAGIIERLSAEL